MDEVNRDIVDLFMDIETIHETDSRYDKMTISRCRKGLEYLEHDVNKSLTIRYWTFTRFQWWTFMRILDKISGSGRLRTSTDARFCLQAKSSGNLTDLKIIGCGIDNKRFKDIITVLKNII
jgi:hypothetical protein